MNIEHEVELPISKIRELILWSRENRVPLIHRWLEPQIDIDCEYIGDHRCSCGTRGLFGNYEHRTGSSSFEKDYDEDETFCIVFFVRERDYPLWLLRV